MLAGYYLVNIANFNTTDYFILHNAVRVEEEVVVVEPISLNALDAKVQAAEAHACDELEHATLLNPKLAELLRQEELTDQRAQSTVTSGCTTVRNTGSTAGPSTRAASLVNDE